MSTQAQQTNKTTQNSTDSLLLEESKRLRLTNAKLKEKVQSQTAALEQSSERLKVEIAERKNTKVQLQRRITFDQFLTTLASNFINVAVNEIDAGINQALFNVVAFHECDRAYIYLFDKNGRSLHTTHHWQKPTSSTNFADFNNLPFNLFSNWMPRLQNQETFIVENIGEADTEIESERKLLAMQRIKSALIIPLVFEQETIGYLSIDSFDPDNSWCQDTIDGLKMIGFIFVNALMRKHNEAALSQERNFAQRIMDNMGQGLIVSNIEGCFEYVNSAYANMLGNIPELLVGKTALDTTCPEDHHKLIQAQMENLEGITSSYEVRLLHADGSWVYTLINSVPNQDQYGQVIGSISTVTDLTDRYNIEAQVEANAEETKLIYKAAMQLFQPTSVQGLAEQIASITVDELGFESCGVLMLDTPIRLKTDRIHLYPIKEENYLERLALIGSYQNDAKSRLSLMGDGLVATAVRKGEILYIPDVSQDPRYLPENTYTQSEMVIPLRAYNHIIGAIDLQSAYMDGFDERARRIITVFAENAGLALETVRLYDKLRQHTQELEQQINERQRIEQALRQSENRYKQLVENATDMLYRTDAMGNCTYANPVTIHTLGYNSANELVGKHFTDFIHPDFKEMLSAAYNKLQQDQSQNTYLEFIAVDQNQTEIWVGQNVQPITEQGQIIGYQALARDITKRRKAENELRARSSELNATNAKLAKALRAKDEFLANMSHELRTPLNAILGKSEILLEGIHGDLNLKQESSLQVISESGTHLLELINDILDLAKIEAGKIKLDIKNVSITNLCESSMQFVRQMAIKKQIRLQANIERSLKTCKTDERRLKQILINLLSNAVKFTPSGGEVGLNVLKVSELESIQFQVWDTGIGIPSEDMGKLFQPFVQLDSSLDRSHEGTGLGLSLVYRLTDLLGGSVSLESQVGVGSCFTITLPLNLSAESNVLQKQAKMEWQQATEAQLTKNISDKQPRILLVEDNEANVETVTEYLPVWGYQMLVAHSGVEGLEMAKREQPDLILMDIHIPEMDGLTAIRQLRRDEAFHDTPIIALTALAMHGDRERCLEAGANEFLSKPIQLRQLAITINELLTNKLNMIEEPTHE